MFRAIAHRVFRCFRKVEKAADRLTSKVGPVFVGLAAILISLCIVTFFDVIFPAAFLQPSTHPLVGLTALLFCLYMSACVGIHYRLCCTTPPGSPLDPLFVPEPRPAPSTDAPSSMWTSFKVCLPGNRTSQRRNDRTRGDTIKALKAKQARLESQSERIEASELASRSHEDGDGDGREARRTARSCKKCEALGIRGLDGEATPPKPERAHHCRVCARCSLKFDHHCPWINGCVGLHNERYFLLFLFYLSFSCLIVVVAGWSSLLDVIDFGSPWEHKTPRTFTLLTWILAAAMGFAVGIMGWWQLWQVIKGETSVESSDNDYYRKVMKSRGQVFVNPYNLGAKQNLAQFFNVYPYSHRSWWSILWPTRVPPASDGWTWEKQNGWETKVVGFAEELTDDEEENDD